MRSAGPAQRLVKAGLILPQLLASDARGTKDRCRHEQPRPSAPNLTPYLLCANQFTLFVRKIVGLHCSAYGICLDEATV
jgi:hypothetical protein